MSSYFLDYGNFDPSKKAGLFGGTGGGAGYAGAVPAATQGSMDDYLNGKNGKGYSLTNGLANVGSTYWDALGRSPEQGVMNWYESQIASGADINQILNDIRNSPEAKARLGTPPATPQAAPLPQVPQGGGYTSANPYLADMGNEIGRRTQQNLGQAFNQIRSNSIGVGGLGGSRQGVAEGIATRGAMDSLQGNLAGLYGGQYNQDANRDLTRYQADQNFYTSQRGQDLSQIGLGANIYNMANQGQWTGLNNASNLFNSTAGNNVTGTNTSQQGGGWQGALGGALAGGAFGKQMNWWG